MTKRSRSYADRICKKPGIGSVPSKSKETIRRVMMKTTKNHVYYAVRDNEIVVLSVWGAPKERGPKL